MLMKTSAPVSATAFLDDLADSFDGCRHAVPAGKFGFSISDFVAKAQGFRAALDFLRASGIGDGTILTRILDVLSVVLANLGNIAAIISAIAALFGVPAPTPAP